MSSISDLTGKLDLINQMFNGQVANHPALELEDASDLDLDHVANIASQVADLLEEALMVLQRRAQQEDVDWDD